MLWSLTNYVGKIVGTDPFSRMVRFPLFFIFNGSKCSMHTGYEAGNSLKS